MFGDLTLHPASCGVSEGDAEGVSSMQKDSAGVCGTRFGITTMEAGLRSTRHFPTRRPHHEEVALMGADWPAWIPEDIGGP
jgi:hypothetical protein